MKNLLIIAYYFPPSGGPGVQRVLKHIKYLPEFGWRPIVLTVSNGQFPARDESLMRQLPEDLIVKRSRIYEPYDIYRLLTGKKQGEAIDVNTIKKDSQQQSTKEIIAEFIRATFFIPDARIGWLPTANRAVKEIIKEHRIDAVYSSSPPYTCSLIARKAAKMLDVPWVAGFRDPWTGFISSPKRWFLPRYIDKKMEFNSFNEADAVECAWEGIIKDALGKYPALDRDKFHHVPNGYDSSDFPAVECAENDKFTVTYTGSLYGRRNPAGFFAAIESLIEQGKVNPKDIRLQFIGRFGAEVEEMYGKVSFRDSIVTHGYVPHRKSIEFLLKSDALLLIVDESKESQEIVPGKVYEYIGVKKPIIAIAPQNSAIAKLLAETNSGSVAHQSEIKAIAGIFHRLFTAWKEGNKTFNPNLTAVNNYERSQAAKKLAALLDRFI